MRTVIDASTWWENKNFTYWNNIQNQRLFFDWISNKLSIRHPDDWYRITRNQIGRYGGSTLLQTYYSNSFIKGALLYLVL